MADRREEIATAWLSGQSTAAELAAAHGVSAATVRSWAAGLRRQDDGNLSAGS